MCTLTILRAGGDLQLTINRDEHRSRVNELPPTILPAGSAGLQMLLPRDSASGGSWVGANSLGLVAALLNFYTDDEKQIVSPPTVKSRGEIVPSVLGQGDFAAVLDFLQTDFDPAPYPPFSLLVCDLRQSFLLRWYGEAKLQFKKIDQPELMLTSSGWNSRAVEKWRHTQFEAWKTGGRPYVGAWPAVHLLKPAGRETWGTLMSRAEACTRSITQIRLRQGGEQLDMSYWPKPSETTAGAALCSRLKLSAE